jgi:polyisoprenoid-binding protein YceI
MFGFSGGVTLAFSAWLRNGVAAALFQCILLGAAAGTAVCAAPVAIDLDPSKTRIEFTLADALHTVHGTFRLKSGHIELNPESKAISGQVLVDASSGESGSRARDSRMKKSILDVDQYPEIAFTPLAVEGDVSGKSSSVTVTGWFEIHGQRHQLSIPMHVAITGDQVSAAGKFVVPYVAWGMKNPSVLLLRVKEQVDVSVAAIGTVSSNAGR